MNAFEHMEAVCKKAFGARFTSLREGDNPTPHVSEFRVFYSRANGERRWLQVSISHEILDDSPDRVGEMLIRMEEAAH